MRWLQNSRRRSTHWDPLRIAWPGLDIEAGGRLRRCRRSDAFGRFWIAVGPPRRPTSEFVLAQPRSTSDVADAASARTMPACGHGAAPSRAYGRLSASGLAVATGSFEHQPRLLVRQRHVPSRIAFDLRADLLSRERHGPGRFGRWQCRARPGPSGVGPLQRAGAGHDGGDARGWL